MQFVGFVGFCRKLEKVRLFSTFSIPFSTFLKNFLNIFSIFLQYDLLFLKNPAKVKRLCDKHMAKLNTFGRLLIMEECELKRASMEKMRDNEIDRRVVSILLSVGISANLQGYYFLKESIRMAIVDPMYIGSITKTMYPKVASRYQTTACRVERAIRHAIDVSYNKGKIILLNEIFGLNIYDEREKPTNAEFVALIADRLSMDLAYVC